MATHIDNLVVTNGFSIDGYSLPSIEIILTTLYVDIVAGSDDNDGTTGSPLATIQEAINRYLPSWASPPIWDSDRKITVVHTPGMPSITEELIKPAHTGDGILWIQGEARIEEASIIQSGTIDLETGHQALRRINFTTSPFTEGSLTDGYFVSWTDKSFGASSEASITMPIVHNGDGYALGLLYYGEEIWWSDGVEYEIIQPQIVWDENPNSSILNPLIMNNGGRLIVEGFVFDRQQRNPGRSQPLMCDNAEIGGE